MSTSARYYSRLFAGHRPGYPADVLKKLAESLRDEDHNHDNDDDETNEKDNRKDRRRRPGSCSSGYAYFGQFITHDLSRDGTELPNAGKEEPEETKNERTACLDLEPLYGRPHSAPSVKRLGNKLLLGNTLPSEELELESTYNDLPRDSKGIAEIYDKRNDTSLLLAQLHVLLIKFHNRIVDDLCHGNIPSAGPDSSLFARARRLVTWHYQWIVRYDYLLKLVAPDVLQDITMHWPRLYRPTEGNAAVPVEFAWAAFQYGHSAVQNSYNINRYHHRLPLGDLFCLTGNGEEKLRLKRCADPTGNTQLPEEYVVDPGRMFGWGPPGISNVSEEIDTLIPSAFYELPLEFVIQLTNESPERLRDRDRGRSLTEITLLRGSGIGIPSGQEACRLSGVEPLAADQLAHTPQLKNFLYRNGLVESTPLFYYILREAEVAGRASVWGRPCKRLGPLGSRIVAEVILGVLNADTDSFTHAVWQPPLICLNQGRTIRVDSLKKLALYASGHADWISAEPS